MNEVGSLGDAFRRPTQKDVARLAQVSPMTVSRTLAGGKNVRPSIQRKVIEAVRALNYLPNESARSLRPGQQVGTIGVVVPNTSYFGTFVLGVEDVARDHRKYLLMGTSRESAALEEELVDAFLSRRVEGLVVVPAGEPTPRRWVERLGNVPIVAAARELEDIAVDTIVIDDQRNAHDATRQLLDEGHQRIAFVGNIVTISSHKLRYDGYIAALATAGIREDERLVRGVTDDIPDARENVRAFFELSHPPTALIAANASIATGVLLGVGDKLREGMEPPPQVVTFDSLDLAELLIVPVRVYGHHPQEVGRLAATALFRRIEGEQSDPDRHIVSSRLVTASGPLGVRHDPRSLV